MLLNIKPQTIPCRHVLFYCLSPLVEAFQKRCLNVIDVIEIILYLFEPGISNACKSQDKLLTKYCIIVRVSVSRYIALP